MRRFVMSMTAAAALAVGVVAADGAANPTFASTGECAGGPGPVCRVERTCTAWDWEVGWPLRFSRTCVSWVEETFYWTYTEDGGEALPPGEEEPAPQTPEAG